VSRKPSDIPRKVQENRSRRVDSSTTEAWKAPGNLETFFDREWQPLHSHLIVRRIPDPKALFRIIIAPDNAQSEEQNHGIVVKVGPGKRRAENDHRRDVMELKPGDHVIFGKYTDFDFWQSDCCIIQEGDVRVVVEKEATTHGAAHRRRTQAA
jgi:co-chaperonin GroES (HSP10)